MTVKKKFVLRELMGEFVLVPCGDTVTDNNGLFMMTETGAYIWKILPEVRDEAEILTRLLAEYDVTEQQAKDDIEAFLAKLRTYDIID